MSAVGCEKRALLFEYQVLAVGFHSCMDECTYACVCVRVRERESEEDCVCVFVCLRERKREGGSVCVCLRVGRRIEDLTNKHEHFKNKKESGCSDTSYK